MELKSAPGAPFDAGIDSSFNAIESVRLNRDNRQLTVLLRADMPLASERRAALLQA